MQHYANFSPTIVFVLSFIALVPLAALVGFAADQLIIRVGRALGGLLNAAFGNTVEVFLFKPTFIILILTFSHAYS